MDRANILVVDDRPDKHVVYSAVLDELDHNLVHVNSGQEALKEVLKREFAVILLDVNMPGIDGLETAALIRRRKRSAHSAAKRYRSSRLSVTSSPATMPARRRTSALIGRM